MRLDPNDTIVALSSASGIGARAVVRLSGPKAVAIAQTVFATSAPVQPNVRRAYTGGLQLPGVAAALPAEHGVRVICHVACGINLRVRGLQEFVDHNAVLHLQPRCFCQFGVGNNPQTGNDSRGNDFRAAGGLQEQLGVTAFQAGDVFARTQLGTRDGPAPLQSSCIRSQRMGGDIGKRNRRASKAESPFARQHNTLLARR